MARNSNGRGNETRPAAGTGEGTRETPGTATRTGTENGTGTGSEAGSEAAREAGTGTGASTASPGSTENGGFFRNPLEAFKIGIGTGEGTGEKIRNKGGRPKGSKTRNRSTGSGQQTKAQVQASLEGLESILLSLHMMASKLTKIDELELSEDEAHKLAAASANVAKHYNIQVSAKAMAWAELAGVASYIYGPRFGAYAIRKETEKEAKKPKPAPAPVIPFAQGTYQQQPPADATM